MKLKVKGTILTAETKSFKNDDDSDIVYHRARINIGGEIYPVKLPDEKTVEALKHAIGNEGEVELDLTSRREKIALEFVDIII